MSFTIGDSSQVSKQEVHREETAAITNQTEFRALAQKILAGTAEGTAAELSTELDTALNRLPHRTRDDMTIYFLAVKTLGVR